MEGMVYLDVSGLARFSAVEVCLECQELQTQLGFRPMLRRKKLACVVRFGSWLFLSVSQQSKVAERLVDLSTQLGFRILFAPPGFWRLPTTMPRFGWCASSLRCCRAPARPRCQKLNVLGIW